ncbi:MAG: hypothetical protein R2909_12425 [Gemmatimonadales bacterium]
MVTPADPLRELRALLDEGRYRDVLVRWGETDGAAADPSLALGLATAAARLGELERAERLALQARERYRQRADDDGRLRCSNLLGAVAFERGAVEKAALEWAAALEAARAAGDTLMVARVSNNLSSARHLRGEVVEARSLFREALVAYQRLAARFAAESAHNLGLTYREADELDLAGRRLKVRHAELVAEPGLLALTLTGRAETRVALGQVDLANADLDRAVALASRIDDRIGVAEAGRVRAALRLAIGDPAGAAAEAEAARETGAVLGSSLLQAEAAALLATALASIGQTGAATARREEARALFTRMGATAHLARLDRQA